MQPRGSYRLKILLGDSAGQVLELTQAETVIGRGHGAMIVLPDSSVSRNHARLVFQGQGYAIEDLGSANGTFVNGQRLTGRQPLNPGDHISLGQSVILEYDLVPSSLVQGPETTAEKMPAAQGAPGSHPTPGQPGGRAGAPMTIAYDDSETYVSQQPGVPSQIIVTVAGENPRTHTLTAPAITIGRTSENDIVIQSEIVSRRHARLEKINGGYQIALMPGTTNPTYLEGQLLQGVRLLHHNDVLRIGSQEAGLMVTLTYISPGDLAAKRLRGIKFGSKTLLQIGRDPDNDIVLDGPMVSRFHAQVERVGQRYRCKDLRSMNGTFVNDLRTEGEVWLNAQDTVRIGPYRFVLGADQLTHFDESGGLRVDAIGLNKWVREDLNILQNISLSFKPREFVVVVGQSGGGKTTLVDAIAGYRPATHGQVYVNDIDIYRHFDAIRSNIGYVPQRDIIHMELTVYQALDYAAKLRMPPDTSPSERHQRIMEVMSDLDLEHRKDVQISGLSGGQQKRVSIGVELLTKPGLFFLDEPTSGLDPGTETVFMQLMRRLADQGRTVVLITHATKNVMLADKVVFLARGGYLAWLGPPDEALEYFDQYRSERDRRICDMEFDQIYTILDDPSKGNPQDWGQRYLNHPAYNQYVYEPLQGHDMAAPAGVPGAQRVAVDRVSPGVPPAQKQVSALRQFKILSARNLKILTRDRASLILMLVAAPLVGMLDFVLAGAMGNAPLDYMDGTYTAVTISLFLFTIYGVLVGSLSQMREIVKESAIYSRERLVNLKILPYVLSKMWVAGVLALYQAAAYVIIHYLAYEMPGGVGDFLLVYVTMALVTFAGMMMGLFASALAPNANAVPLIVTMLIIPQIVLSGALVSLPGPVTAIISSRWSYEALMSISGMGSDLAADPCWSLPDEERQALSNEDKEERGCLCMGINVFDPDSCGFPGLGVYYDPAIDEPEPVEPAPVGDPPEKPKLPAPPQEPADKNDNLAMSQYVQELQAYQESVDRIQADYQARVAAYQTRVDQYQGDLQAYQEELAEWQMARNGAIGKAEALIRQFQKDFEWTYVDKGDPVAYLAKIVKTWFAQGLIITVLFVLILILMKRKDKVQ